MFVPIFVCKNTAMRFAFYKSSACFLWIFPLSCLSKIWMFHFCWTNRIVQWEKSPQNCQKLGAFDPFSLCGILLYIRYAVKYHNLGVLFRHTFIHKNLPKYDILKNWFLPNFKISNILRFIIEKLRVMITNIHIGVISHLLMSLYR